MNRRITRHALLACSLCATAFALGGSPASADAPDQQGWWTAANPGGVPANPTPPDVPADGLLVQGGAQAPTAYSALIYTLASGGTPEKLTLKVAPNTGTTPSPTVRLCALTTASFTPEQGGPASDAPTYDCNKGKSDGTADSSGTSFTFNVGDLLKDGALNVAVLPGDSTSRVVFSKPDGSSLETVARTATGGNGSAGTTIVSADGPSGTAGSGAPATGLPAAAPLPGQPATTTAANAQSPTIAPASASPAPGGAAPIATTPVAAASSSSTMPRVLGGVAVAGFVVALLLWAFAGGNRGVEPWQPDAS